MKSIISKTVALVAIAAILLSFIPHFGGEGFEISLNGKVLLKQYNKEMEQLKTVQLNEAAPDDLLTIRYYHCGKVGKNRTVTVKDAQGKLLKEFRFEDVPTQMGEMSCKVKDLLNLNKGSNSALEIYYASSELPNGRQLAAVSFAASQDHASINK